MVIITFLLIICGLIARNYNLAKTLFYDWDEGMYAQIAREILKNRSLFTTFNGHIWLDKPPLVHTLIALVFKIFGSSEFWARMLMVAVSFAVLILVYFLAKKIANGNLIASLLPVFTLAASPPFIERATLLNSDIFVAASWLGYFLFWDKYWYKLIFLTIGVWSKSVLGFYPLLIELFYWVWQFVFYHKKIRLNLNLILKSFLLIFISSLWYIAGLLKFGWFFVENHFLSQMLKRLYVPIELHFGNKFFYFNYLWENLKYMNLLLIIGYLLLGYNLIRNKLKIKPLDLILLSPLPFLILLTFMKTKITWYVVIFLPFLILLIPYLYSKLESKILKYILVFFVGAYFALNFFRQTFFLKINYSEPDKLKLARCLSKTNTKEVAFLVDEEERKVKNFLEAAHYDTTSSFLYGGSPSFVFYVQKKVDYYYDADQFTINLPQSPLIVLSSADLKTNKKITALIKTRKSLCQSNNWLAYEK